NSGDRIVVKGTDRRDRQTNGRRRGRDCESLEDWFGLLRSVSRSRRDDRIDLKRQEKDSAVRRLPRRRVWYQRSLRRRTVQTRRKRPRASDRDYVDHRRANRAAEKCGCRAGVDRRFRDFALYDLHSRQNKVIRDASNVTLYF